MQLPRPLRHHNLTKALCLTSPRSKPGRFIPRRASSFKQPHQPPPHKNMIPIIIPNLMSRIAGRSLLLAPIIGCAPLVLEDDGPRADASFDATYVPDRILVDGDSVSGPGWTLTALATPGHTSNHLCFALAEEKALFTGDHVMGWSTSVVSPPDGDMADYMRSLALLMERDDVVYYAAHGAPIETPQRLVRGMMGHRKQREGQILRLLEAGTGHIPDMVLSMYKGVDKRLHGAAGRSVLAHLLDLRGRGLVIGTEEAGWKLAA